MIPYNIFQTHKSKEYINSNSNLINATNSWKKYSNFNYKFYNDIQCRQFIQSYFPDILTLYDKLPLGVMRADLWRYCIIYKYGGIYADVDTVLEINPEIFIKNSKNLIVTPENNTHFCQWVFAAPPNSPILKCIIDLSIERIKNNNNKFNDEHIIHHLTGPGVFTEAILLYIENNMASVLSEGSINTENDIKIKRGNIYESEKNLINYIHVFESNIFHNNYVRHLFAGSWHDGWTKLRDKLIRDNEINNVKKLINKPILGVLRSKNK
uniref:Glycosyltransferase n=1 Tax=viral metagenome TaxID=1070528 RepID=A0A6C0H025_9ZZZZ